MDLELLGMDPIETVEELADNLREILERMFVELRELRENPNDESFGYSWGGDSSESVPMPEFSYLARICTEECDFLNRVNIPGKSLSEAVMAAVNIIKGNKELNRYELSCGNYGIFCFSERESDGKSLPATILVSELIGRNTVRDLVVGAANKMEGQEHAERSRRHWARIVNNKVADGPFKFFMWPDGSGFRQVEIDLRYAPLLNIESI